MCFLKSVFEFFILGQDLYTSDPVNDSNTILVGVVAKMSSDAANDPSLNYVLQYASNTKVDGVVQIPLGNAQPKVR